MRKKYKYRQKLKYIYNLLPTIWDKKYVVYKSRYSHKKDKQEILTEPAIYFEVHFDEVKNKGELHGKTGYFYKIWSVLNFSETNPVRFHNYNSENELRRAIRGFGEIVKITRVTNIQPLVF